VIFTWDIQKAAANLKKHGVDFREAATVFGDLLSLTFPDEAHSQVGAKISDNRHIDSRALITCCTYRRK
jgi:uncharacterized DUF497 family protein